MSFHRNKYLSWYIPRIRGHDDSINLHSSGVPALAPADLGLSSGDPWTASARLEAALADWLGIGADELLFTAGGTGGTLLALLTLAKPGDHVLVECPIYEPMLRQAHRLCNVDRLIRRPESGWRLPLPDVEKLMGPKTRVVMITEPHNPSGCHASSQDVLELAELARQRRAWVLVNEVYRGFGDRPSYHGVADNIVVVSSLSKLLGAYWARIGWLSSSAQSIQRLRQGHLNMGMASSPGAEVGLAIMARADELRDRAVSAARSGQPIVAEWVDATGGLSWHPPQGPGFGCITLPDGIDDVVFAERLHSDHGVLTVPGSYFEAPGTLRLAWLQSGDRLKEGLEIIRREVSNGVA